MRLSFFLAEALESLRRNWVMTIASVLTVLVTMAILGVVLVTDKNLNEGTTSLTNRVEIEVFIKGAPPQQSAIDALHDKIAAMQQQGVVKSFTYVSQAQALQDLRKTLGSNADQIVNNLTTNPLPASYKIFVQNPNQVDQVAAQFFNDPNVDNDPGTTNGVSYAKADRAQPARHRQPGREGDVGGDRALRAGRHPAHLDHRAPVDLRAPPRGRDHAARGRHQLVHPLALRARGLHHRPRRLASWRPSPCGAPTGLVYNWIHQSKLDFLRPIRYPLVAQSGSWPLGLIPTLVLAGAVLGALGSALALRRYLRV